MEVTEPEIGRVCMLKISWFIGCKEIDLWLRLVVKLVATSKS